MAKFNPAADLEHYNTNSGANYFSLKDDGDTALVRFMYNGAEDIEAHCVHEVEVQEGPYKNKKTVSCLREYADPLDKCPLCEARFKTSVKFYVPLYNIDTKEVCLWNRGPGKNNSFYSQLSTLCREHNPLVSYPIEIERCGAKGDTNTTYEYYAQESDGTLLEDLPEVPDPMGTLILEKSYDELLTFVQTGSFEIGDNNPVNRDSQSSASTGAEVRRRRDVSASGIRRRNMGSNDIPL